MGEINRSLPKVPADQGFLITVGVPHKDTQKWCGRAINALERAGFTVGPTSDESIKIIAAQARLVDGLVANDD